MINKHDIKDMQDFPQPSASINNKQVGGTHYQRLNPAPWDVVIAWNLGYLEGTALKYIARWQDKGGIEDIKKAIHFLEKLVVVKTPASPVNDWVAKQNQSILDLAKVVEQWQKYE